MGDVPEEHYLEHERKLLVPQGVISFYDDILS